MTRIFLFDLQSIFQLNFNGEQCVASEVGKHNTGTAVMNCSTFEDTEEKKMYIVAGQDDHSQLHHVSKKLEIGISHSSSDQIDNNG